MSGLTGKLNNGSRHLGRIHRTTDHMRANLDRPLNLAALAQVAHLSAWHFQRLYRRITGESPAEALRRLRLESAAMRLRGAQTHSTVLAVAQEVGFASPEVFCRAFKAHFGMSPSAWKRGGFVRWMEARGDRLADIRQQVRKKHQDASRQIAEHPLLRTDCPLSTSDGVIMELSICQLSPVRVAYMRHIGPYGHPGIPQAWGRFMQWCDSRGLMKPRRDTFGVSLDNPFITPAERLRYDLCVSVPEDFQLQSTTDAEVSLRELGGGRFARVWFHGTGLEVGPAFIRMFKVTLPERGEIPDESRHAFEWYDASYTLNEATGEFGCWLCIPLLTK